MYDEILDPIKRLTRDLRSAAINLGDEEARFLVDAYYIVQEDRKRSFSQKRELEKNEEPNEVITWFANQSETLEDQIKVALDAYTENHLMGSWMRSIYGIGPVLSAGLLAHIDIKKAVTVGHIWQYAGIAGKPADTSTMRAVYRVTFPFSVDINNPPKLLFADGQEATYLYPDGEALMYQLIIPGEFKPPQPLIPQELLTHREITVRLAEQKGQEIPDVENDGYKVEITVKVISGQTPWNKGQKRPYNANLKTLLWKVGQSFMKLSNREQCFYGKIYRERKEYEIGRNEAGELADQAAVKLPFIKDKSSEAYKAYSQGKLPPGHLDARARRYAVKLFLAHMHAEWYRREFDAEPPLPYPIAMLGHVHFIEPPA